MGVEGNERADEEAKRAAKGRSSHKRNLPPQIHKTLPRSRTSAVRTFRAELERRHNEDWRKSTRYTRFKAIDESNATTASRAYWKLSQSLSRKLLAILTQLRTGHAPLQQHLHRIKQVDSPTCPCCKRYPETVFHYLMECRAHRTPRAQLRQRVRGRDWNIKALLTEAWTLKYLFIYVNDTGRFHHIVGNLPLWGEDE